MSVELIHKLHYNYVSIFVFLDGPNHLLMKGNPILSKSVAFSLEAIKLYKSLIESREYVLSKQFFRSVTNIGANVNEASAAMSYKDFAYKMSIASKEARESLYWLELIEAGKFTNYNLIKLKN